MSCTTLLVGKKASYDGSTMIARTDDGDFGIKQLISVAPSKKASKYESKLSHLKIDLPADSLRYTSNANVDLSRGLWAANGINSLNVAMTATETTTSNALVLGADPYVGYQKAKTRREKDIPGGIGEEDMVALVLPFIRSAREGVLRLGSLLEQYGTYESNGIAFSDRNEIWWFETIGGHHWIARRVQDDEVVIMPNQFGLDRFDINDAFGAQKENLCSPDMKDFIARNHLDLNNDGSFNPRNVFGSHSDSDHIFNTPRAWYMGRCLCPTRYKWDGDNADFTPLSDNIPWSFVPERKLTVEEMKYILSSHYQGTKYDPYNNGDDPEKGTLRPIAKHNTRVMAVLQIRDYMPDEISAVEWLCFGPTAFDAMTAVYANADKFPPYLSKVGLEVSTDNFFWSSRLIAAMADGSYRYTISPIEQYQRIMATSSHRILNEYDAKMTESGDYSLIDEANEKLTDNAKQETTKALGDILAEASAHMKIAFNRADH